MSQGVLMREFKQQLPVRLLAEENAEYAKDLTSLMKDLENKKEDAKASAASYRSSCKTLEGRVNYLRDVVNENKITRDVKVAEYHDAFKRKCVVYRQDTGEQVSERDLSEQELTALRQGQLKLAEVKEIG